MINNGLQLEAEAYHLAALELGVDPEKLASLAKFKRNEVLSNLSLIFDKEFEALNDANWDADELKTWLQKVNPKFEERMAKTNMELLSFEDANVPDVSKRSTFSPLEHKCMDLSGNLLSEKEAFHELASELEAKEPLTFDVEKFLRSAPFLPQPRSSPVSAAKEQAN